MTSSKEKTQQTSSTVENPWAVQAPYLQSGFEAAKGALSSSQNLTSPSNFVAQFNPEQLNIFQKMIGYGTGNDQLAGNTAAAGQALTNTGVGATQGALSGLEDFKPTGGVDTNIAEAGKYAANPQMDAMVTAAMRDSTRAVNEEALPAIARNAAATGNLSSSKRAISEGILQRGLADRTADVSAALRGDAYQKGIATAESGRQFDNNAALEALQQRGALGLSAAGAGVGANGAAIDQMGGLFDIANAGAGGMQAADQAKLDNELAKYGFDSNKLFEALNNYWGIVGSNSWGGTSNSTGTKETTKTPSVLSSIGQAVGIGGSLLKGGK